LRHKSPPIVVGAPVGGVQVEGLVAVGQSLFPPPEYRKGPAGVRVAGGDIPQRTRQFEPIERETQSFLDPAGLQGCCTVGQQRVGGPYDGRAVRLVFG